MKIDKVKIEEVKEELNRYKHDCKLIDDYEKEVEFYNSKLLACTSEISDMPKGGPMLQDKIAEYIARLEDLKTEKYKRLIELEDRKELVEKIVSQLKQPYQTLLYITYMQEHEYRDVDGSKRTIIGNTLKETSWLMNYEYKYTCCLHGRALIEYLKVRVKQC